MCERNGLPRCTLVKRGPWEGGEESNEGSGDMDMNTRDKDTMDRKKQTLEVLNQVKREKLLKIIQKRKITFRMSRVQT